ncbi:MAG: tetratricopeptide repeat protein [Sterolibacterium sp.]|jgi:Flp pilus assembly protein TadD|nr:tetratricopeptide repeat protein [Sterolibacterium sp.]
MKPNPYPHRYASLISRRHPGLLPALLCIALLGPPGLGAAAEPAGEVAGAGEVASRPQPTGATEPRREPLPQVVLTPKILYETVLAEIAARRGNLLLATRVYNELAKTTRDPRIAKRATEFALYTRQSAPALESARIWVQTDPESVEARLNLADLLLAARHDEEAMTQLSRLLAIDSGKQLADEMPENDAGALAERKARQAAGMLSTSDRIGQIYLLFARQPGKAESAQRFEQLTLPYEQLPRTQYLRALSWFAAKDEARALAAIDRAITLKPDWAEPVLLKVRLQQRISSTQAEQTLKDFLAKYPKSSEVRLAYARSLIGDKNYEAARREYDQLLATTPDDGEVLYASALLAMQVDDFPVAERHMKRLLELGIGNSNLLRFYLGRMAEDARQPEQAIAWYIQVTPGEQYLPAWSRAAALRAKAGTLDEGRALLQQAAAAHPQEQKMLLLAESQMLVDAGRVADAYDLLNKQLAHQPDQPELLYETALLAEKLNRLEVMERHLRKLIRIKPEDAHAYNALGYSLVEHGQRFEEAAKLIDQGLTLAPEDAFIIDSKGWLLYKRGEREAALSTLQKAYEIRADPEIAAHLGEVLWVSGKTDEATKVWEAALKTSPANRLLRETYKKFKGLVPDNAAQPDPAGLSDKSGKPSKPDTAPQK